MGTIELKSTHNTHALVGLEVRSSLLLRLVNIAAALTLCRASRCKSTAYVLAYGYKLTVYGDSNA
jgi:hypothetical protein